MAQEVIEHLFPEISYLSKYNNFLFIQNKYKYIFNFVQQLGSNEFGTSSARSCINVVSFCDVQSMNLNSLLPDK